MAVAAAAAAAVMAAGFALQSSRECRLDPPLLRCAVFEGMPLGSAVASLCILLAMQFDQRRMFTETDAIAENETIVVRIAIVMRHGQEEKDGAVDAWD